jgi:hypothetical protein
MKRLLLLLLCLGLAGCASFYASRYPNDDYPATSPESIPIYNNYPPVPYEIIGEVGGNGAPASSWQGMGKRIREYAAQMGGDAVVIAEQATPYVGTYTTPTTVNTTSSAYGSGTFNANIYGNNIYGNSYGQAWGQSHTVINPGSSIPMYGKSVKAYVIKYKQSDNNTNADENVATQVNNGEGIEDKLKTLNKLLTDGFITKDEYEIRKQKLLSEYTSK